MTVLITGGAGFIGSRLTSVLTGAGESVIVFDNLHPQVHGDDAADPEMPSGARFVRGDVADFDALQAIVREARPTVVYHLAAETGTGQSLLESRRHANVNVSGTACLMDALSATDCIPERVILTSSRAVYGEGSWRQVADGSVHYPGQRTPKALQAGVWDPLLPLGKGTPVPHAAASVEPRPTNVYAATKLAQEQLLSSWTQALGSRLVTLRLQNVYGAGQALGNPYTGVLTYFTTQALEGRTINVYEGGGIVRDFVHISDVVDALAAAWHAELPACSTRTVDIGSDAPMSLEDAARILVDVVGSGVVEITDQFRLGDVRAASADITEARHWLGYEPAVDFRRGAAELSGWARGQIG